MGASPSRDGDKNSTAVAFCVDAEVSSAETTARLRAGTALGQPEKDGGGQKAPVKENLFQRSPVPLFLRDRSEGRQGNAQDEKDGTEE